MAVKLPVITLLTAATAMSLVGCGQSAFPASGRSTSVSAAPAPAPEPAVAVMGTTQPPLASARGPSWTRISLGGDATVNDVVTDGSRVVVTGARFAGDIPLAIWTSTDGVHYANAIGDAGGLPGIVVAGRAGFAGFGYGNGATIYTSANGRTWVSHRLPLDWTPQPELAGIDSVAVGHGVVVALGWSSNGATAGQGANLRPDFRQRRESWWSTDGSDWRIGTTWDLGSSPGSGNLPNGPIVVTDTGFVAMSASGGFWRSEDGRAWLPVPGSRNPGMAVAGLAYFAGRYVALSENGIGVSDDLSTWRQLEPEALMGAIAHGHNAIRLTATGGALYAVGAASDLTDPTAPWAPAGLWRSSDGLTWTTLPIDPQMSTLALGGLAVLHGRVIVAAMNGPDPSDPSRGPSNGSVIVSRDLLLDSAAIRMRPELRDGEPARVTGRTATPRPICLVRYAPAGAALRFARSSRLATARPKSLANSWATDRA